MASESSSQFLARLTLWARRHDLSRRLPFIISLAAVLSGIATYLALTSSANLADRNIRVLPLIYLDIVLLLLLAVIVAKRLVELWQERKRGQKGAKLHIHIVLLFSLVSVTPAIILGLFSPLFFNAGLETWFGRPVRAALEEAREVANAYLLEHQRSIFIDAQSLVNHLRPFMPVFISDPETLEDVLNQASEERGLGEIIIFTGQGEVVGRSFLSFSLAFDLLPKEDFERAQNDPSPIVRTTGDRMRALIRLDPITDTYLYVGKIIDPKVLQHVSLTETAVESYQELTVQHASAHIVFLVFFSLVGLLLLLSAVWIGLTLANTLVQPIRRLIGAAEEVSQGNLSIKIEESQLNNEVDDLIISFNRMTHRLRQQNYDLAISQRKAAWADVARRIAHEIKNPLTPIQLSAERLKRRYMGEIQTDPKTFQNCIDTIIRQVEHIGNLVMEFSAFARMPEPELTMVDVGRLSEETLSFFRQAHGGIQFDLATKGGPLEWLCDLQQVQQVITNLVQNAINAVLENKISSPKVCFSLTLQSQDLVIKVEDNGPGFPAQNREQFLEPYYTTRDKGTGLGLAIVSKIVSDHNGYMELGESDLGGAMVTITLRPKN
jgi:two-component system nitrogen regulation sensor histidine kinase NtrY